MSTDKGRRDALDFALRHLGSDADHTAIFSLADQFKSYLEGNRPHAPFAWNTHLVNELREIAGDPLKFLDRIEIQHPIRGAVPFQPYEFQKDLVTMMTTNRLSHITCARQMGVSTCIAATMLWLAMFDGNNVATVLMCSKRAIGVEKLDHIRSMHAALPEHLRVAITTNRKDHIVFDNGASIWVDGPSANICRGRAVKNLFFDEMAYFSHKLGRDVWDSVQPILSSGGRCVVASSAHDTDGIFYDIGQSMPHNGFIGMVLPWHRHPGRDAAWAKQFREILGEAAWASEYECQFVSQRRPAPQRTPQSYI